MAGSPLAHTFKVEGNPEVTTVGRFLTSVDIITCLTIVVLA